MSNHEQAVSRVHTTSCYREELVLIIVYINLGTLVSLFSTFLPPLTIMKLCTCCFIAGTLIFVALFSRESVMTLLKVRPLWMGGLASVANVSKKYNSPIHISEIQILS